MRAGSMRAGMRAGSMPIRGFVRLSSVLSHLRSPVNHCKQQQDNYGQQLLCSSAANNGCGLESKQHSQAGTSTSPSALRKVARTIFRAGCRAVEPYQAVRSKVTLSQSGCLIVEGQHGEQGEYAHVPTKVDLATTKKLYVLSFGKAAVGMARAVSDIVGPNRVSEGVVVAKHVNDQDRQAFGDNFDVFVAAHPLPDANSVQAATRVIEVAAKAQKDDLVIVCISGGGSALLCKPADGIELGEMQDTVDQMLACGATVDEKNCVLKHLSQVKGGQLRKHIGGASCISLVLSDVVGDPLDVIASGPTVADSTTLADALQILGKYKLESGVSGSCLQHLRNGDASETPKAKSGLFDSDTVCLVATNAIAVAAAAEKAQDSGFEVLQLGSQIEGDAIAVGQCLAGILKSAVNAELPIKPPLAIICGGETTMTLPKNPGLGGRNQALALSALKSLSGVKRVAFLSGGTDGGDGPKNDAAGAVVTGEDYVCSQKLGLKYSNAMDRADSYSFFKSYEQKRFGRENILHLRDGPTGTNVMDLVIMLVV